MLRICEGDAGRNQNLDEISVFIDIDMPEVNGFEVASYLKSGTGMLHCVCIE